MALAGRRGGRGGGVEARGQKGGVPVVGVGGAGCGGGEEEICRARGGGDGAAVGTALAPGGDEVGG